MDDCSSSSPLSRLTVISGLGIVLPRRIFPAPVRRGGTPVQCCSKMPWLCVRLRVLTTCRYQGGGHARPLLMPTEKVPLDASVRGVGIPYYFQGQFDRSTTAVNPEDVPPYWADLAVIMAGCLERATRICTVGVSLPPHAYCIVVVCTVLYLVPPPSSRSINIFLLEKIPQKVLSAFTHLP